jgi:hypothetical protein
VIFLVVLGPVILPLNVLLLPMNTDEQRTAIRDLGTPCPLVDETTGALYVLLKVAVERLPGNDGFRARVPGIPAIGEGDDPTEATFALTHALHGSLSADAESL